MKKTQYLILLLLTVTSCAVSRKINNEEIELKFLDEYVIPADQKFEQTQVGGLSGIDFKNGTYYLVSDQASAPRIYTAKIGFNNQLFDSIKFTGLIEVRRNKETPAVVLDLEALRFDETTNTFIISSEGKINDGMNPGLYSVSKEGRIQSSFPIPKYFNANGDQEPRDNGVFEGLSESTDQNGFWTVTELPLIKDGAKPKLYPTRSHVRFTKFDKESGKALRQFAYKLDGISKLPINFFAINGVTEILEYAEDKFLVLERAYSAGYGSKGNTVKIFSVDATNATNTLEMDRLKGSDYELAKKSLVFNFKSVKDQLTQGIIDNIEGMTFGPELENGKRSLILVSDNNFNTFAKQLNQFILMEIDFK